MLQGSTSPVVRYIRKLAGTPASDHAGDGALLERFARRHDEEAFAELLRRYSGLILGVCRRVLQHEQDAEDAFQATFLVLALEDVRAAQLTFERYLYEAKSKAEAVKVSQGELQQARAVLGMTEIRSPCRGIIQNIFLHRGEGVRALEPVFAIQVPEGSD